MGEWTVDIRNACIDSNGAARFTRVLFDAETGVLYFDHHGVSVTEVWLNGSSVSDDDFGVWNNNSLNNDNAEVLWQARHLRGNDA